VFELKAVKAQDSVVSKRPCGRTKYFTTRYGMPEVCVRTRNVVEEYGCIEEEKAKPK
jgi:hypothetical protein